MKTILIFGATGTIGAYTTIYLKNRGYNVVAIGRRTWDNGFFEENQIPYYSIDIVKENDFNKLTGLKNIGTIVHLAGVMPATMNGYDPEKYVDSIIKGTLNVLNYAVHVNAEKIVFSQSRADSNYLMGKTPIPSDIIKKFPLKGDHSVYSICKNAAVDLIEHFYHQYGLKRFVLRLPTIYAYHPNKYFFVNGVRKTMAYRYIIDQVLKGKDVEVWGDPSKAKEIVYIGDAEQLIEKCILSTEDGGIYNLGRGVAISLDEQIKGIIEVFSTYRSKSKIIYKPDKPDGREYVNDISKTCKELGFKPLYDYHALLIAFKVEMEKQRFKKLWGIESDYENE